MDLPADLLHSVSSPGGGKITLVVGAGCSVEAPTGLPLARQCSEEIHQRLITDGVLQHGDCTDSTDLSAVADAVFAKRNSQRDVVERLRDYDLKLAPPNDGYLIAAAMLCEGVISSVVTLNFDLALSTALSELGAGRIVGVIDGPEDLPRQKIINVYYLHGNVNATDPDLWVLRTAVLEKDWKDRWEQIVTTKVMTAPVVVFAGLGTPVAVLIASIKLLRRAVGAVTKVYQVDPADRVDSKFFQELSLDPSDYIKCGWCQFMDELSQRLSSEQVAQLGTAVSQKVEDDKLPTENVTNLLARFQALGLVKLGRLRAHWLLHDKPYCPVEPNALVCIADLLLALAMIERESSAVAVLVENGLVEFHRDGRVVAVYMVASGLGGRGRPAIEAAVELRRKQHRTRPAPPCGAIVGGTSDSWSMPITLPTDVLRGNESEDILAGSTPLPLFHISELRANPNRIQQVVP